MHSDIVFFLSTSESSLMDHPIKQCVPSAHPSSACSSYSATLLPSHNHQKQPQDRMLKASHIDLVIFSEYVACPAAHPIQSGFFFFFPFFSLVGSSNGKRMAVFFFFRFFFFFFFFFFSYGKKCGCIQWLIIIKNSPFVFWKSIVGVGLESRLQVVMKALLFWDLHKQAMSVMVVISAQPLLYSPSILLQSKLNCIVQLCVILSTTLSRILLLLLRIQHAAYWWYYAVIPCCFVLRGVEGFRGEGLLNFSFYKRRGFNTQTSPPPPFQSSATHWKSHHWSGWVAEPICSTKIGATSQISSNADYSFIDFFGVQIETNLMIIIFFILQFLGNKVWPIEFFPHPFNSFEKNGLIYLRLNAINPLFLGPEIKVNHWVLNYSKCGNKIQNEPNALLCNQKKKKTFRKPGESKNSHQMFFHLSPKKISEKIIQILRNLQTLLQHPVGCRTKKGGLRFEPPCFLIIPLCTYILTPNLKKIYT
ncbi:hypothetical protein VP01_3640g3 [Puccinia sorghi]|uniref:Uncharacterized protein n=1 Tax=Puccinia sorghi TaxID=27349 RepID=A0A0L6UUM0_9BASI|nr:hypothetical protein VP01_3640g3 [Puccinia sorghi]